MQDDGESEYEKKRRARIASNKRKLAELGLDDGKGLKMVGSPGSASSGNSGGGRRTKTKRRRPTKKVAKVVALPTRRSRRISSLPAPNYKEKSEADVPGSRRSGRGQGAGAGTGAGAAAASILSLEAGGGEAAVRELVYREPSAPDPRSSRAVEADLAKLRRALGDPIPRIGGQVKAAAMYFAAPAGVRPKFSRMSGIQQWHNAVFLFINVGGNDYANIFEEAGEEEDGDDARCHVSWFAQKRQHELTPVILRLIASVTSLDRSGGEGGGESGDGGRGDHAAATAKVKVEKRESKGKGKGMGKGKGKGRGKGKDKKQKKDAESGKDKAEASDSTQVEQDKPPAPEPCEVWLFCRLPGEDYVNCGRLRYRQHWTGKYPLRFRWELCDYKQMVAQGKEEFVRVIRPE